MKSKSKNMPLKRKHEFRFHNVETTNRYGRPLNIKHPAYVFLRKGNVYIYVTITHSKSVRDHIVIKLRKNPNPTDNNDAYYVAEIKKDTIDRFGAKHTDWNIDPLDDEAIRKLFEKEKR